MENNQLVKVIDESGVEKQTAIILQESFMPFFQKANEWSEKAKTLIVTDVSQTREMAMARQARLALREIRIEADKVRKTLKEDSLRYGRAVQGVYNVIEYLIKPTEEYLEQQEKFVELQEAKRKAELKAVREMELQPLIEFVPYGINLSDMAEPDYQKLLNGAKLQMQQKMEEEAREKAAEEARVKAEKEEQERIRQENERLRKEAEEKERQLEEERKNAERRQFEINEAFRIEREKAEKEKKEAEDKARKEREAIEAKAEKEREEAAEKARIEKEKADKILKAEQEEKARLLAEIERKRIAEEKARKEAEEKEKDEQRKRELAEKKAKAEPDKQKLMDFADMLNEQLVWPEVKTAEGKEIVSNTKTLIGKTAAYILQNANKL
jgi:hypothetical protein